MVIQKLKLHEWFLIHQLNYIKRVNNHIPFAVQLDITGHVRKFEEKNETFPLTAFVLKTIGLWAQTYPSGNKMVFRTFMGYRLLMGDEVRINLPIEIQTPLGSAISAIVVKNPQLKSLVQINSEIKDAKSRPFESYPITRFAYTKPNTILNRLFLTVLHSVLNSFPKIYWAKGGGCLSVSSLSNIAKKGILFSSFSNGPTGFTFFFKDLISSEGRYLLNLNISVDHNCYSGVEAAGLTNQLISLFQNNDHVVLNGQV